MNVERSRPQTECYSFLQPARQWRRGAFAGDGRQAMSRLCFAYSPVSNDTLDLARRARSRLRLLFADTATKQGALSLSTRAIVPDRQAHARPPRPPFYGSYFGFRLVSSSIFAVALYLVTGCEGGGYDLSTNSFDYTPVNFSFVDQYGEDSFILDVPKAYLRTSDRHGGESSAVRLSATMPDLSPRPELQPGIHLRSPTLEQRIRHIDVIYRKATLGPDWLPKLQRIIASNVERKYTRAAMLDRTDLEGYCVISRNNVDYGCAGSNVQRWVYVGAGTATDLPAEIRCYKADDGACIASTVYRNRYLDYLFAYQNLEHWRRMQSNAIELIERFSVSATRNDPE